MFSKDHRINMHINNGLFNGETIYIHYTSEEGLKAIKEAKKISANPNRERRGINAKTGVYLTFAKDAMNNDNAFSLLFLGQKKYESSAMYCIVFVFVFNCFILRELRSGPVTSGSYVEEVISPYDIPFTHINIIYDGNNPFFLEKHVA